MSRTVDERVVSMRFDNQQFERGVSQTTQTLHQFKQQFSFKQQENEFDKLQKLVNTFSLTHMASELSMLGDRFGLFGTIAGRVLENITDKAMSTLSNLVNKVGIGFGGIMDGFNEYEIKMKSVQVMLSQIGADADDPYLGVADSMEYSAARISGTLKDLATQVVRGDWGNGVDRINALGEAYQQVQDAVNEAWAAGGKVASGWEKGLETLSDSVMVGFGDQITESSEKAAEGVETNMQHITKILDELNEYADQTVYTFSDMTSAIGTFMTAGIDIDTATKDVQGLSNLAADVGADNNDLKRAMFQLSQGLNTGVIRLQDWMSVERTAGMGGKKFQEAIKQTAREFGVAIDDMIASEGSFRASLKKEWFTADIFNETVNKFTHSGLTDYLVKHSKLTEEDTRALIKNYENEKHVIENTEELSRVLAENSDLTAESIDNYLKQERRMTKAATEVRTATQLLSVIRESIGSGWATTFEHIIGNEQEATELFTGINDRIGEIIGKVADARNQMLLEWKEAGGRKTLLEALSKIFDFGDAGSVIYNLIKPIKDAFLEIFNIGDINSTGLVEMTNKFKAIVENVANFLKDHYEEIKGIAKLVFAYFKIKFNMFMTKVKITLFLLKLFSPVLKIVFELLGKVAGAFGNVLGNSQGLSGIVSSIANSFSGLSSSFANFNLPDFSSLESGLAGVTSSLGNLTGGAGDGIAGVFNSIFGGAGQANQQIEETQETVANAEDTVSDVQDLQINIKELLNNYKITGETDFNDAQRNNIIGLLQSYGITEDDIKEADKYRDNEHSIMKKLEALGHDTDEVEEKITEIVEKHENIDKSIDEAAARPHARQTGEVSGDASVAKRMKDFLGLDGDDVDDLDKSMDRAMDTADNLGCVLTTVSSISKMSVDEQNKYAASGAQTATSLLKGAVESVTGNDSEQKKQRQTVANSTETMDQLTEFAEAIKRFFYIDFASLKKKLDIPDDGKGAFWKILGAIINWLKENGPAIVSVVKFFIGAKILVGLGKLFDGLGEATEGLGVFLRRIGSAVKGFARALQFKAFGAMFRDMAIGIGIMVAAIAAISAIPTDQLAGAVGVLLAIVGVLAVLTFIATKMSLVDSGQLAVMTGFLISFSVTIAIMAAAVKSLGKLDTNQLTAGMIAMAVILGALTTAVSVMKAIPANGNMQKTAAVIIALSIALLLLATAVKTFAKMDPETFYSGLIRVALALGIFTDAVITMERQATSSAKTILALSISLLILGHAIKQFSKMDTAQFYRGLIRVALALFVFCRAMEMLNEGSTTTMLGKGTKAFNPMAKTLLAMAAAMIILGLVLRIIADIPAEKAWPAFAMLSAMMLEMAYLAKEMMKAQGYMTHAKGVSSTLIGFGAALILLSVVVKILGSIPLGQAIQGIILLTALMGELTFCFMAMSIAVGKYNSNLKGATGMLIAMGAMLVLLSITVGILSGIEVNKAMGAVAEIGILMGGIAAMMFAIVEATKIAKPGDIAKGLGLFILLAIIGAGLAIGIRYLTNDVSEEQAKAAVAIAGAVDVLLAGMAGMLVAIAAVTKIGIKKNKLESVKPLLMVLAIIVAGLAAVIGAMSTVANASTCIPLATAVAELLVAMIPVFAALVGIAKYTNNIKGIKGEIIALGFIFDLLASVFTISLAGVLAAIGAIPWDEAIIKGVALLKIIAQGLGEAIGSFVEAISVGMLHAMQNIATGLEAVFGQIINLVEKLKGNVDSNSVDLIKAVIALIVAMTASDMMDALTTWFTTKVLGQKKSNIADRLSDLADGIQKLDEKTKNLDVSRMQRVSQIFDSIAGVISALAALVMTNSMDTLVTWFTGGSKKKNAIATLAEGIDAFIGDGESGFLKIVKILDEGVPDDKVYSVQRKVQMLGDFVNFLKPLQDIMPRTDSIVSIFIGRADGDWGKLGEGLGTFVEKMNQAVITLSSYKILDTDGKVREVSDDDYERARARLETISKFTQSFKEFDTIRGNTPSVKGFLLGEKQDWGQFGRDLKLFVGSMNDAVNTLTTDELTNANGEKVPYRDDATFDRAVTRMGKIGEFVPHLKGFHEIIPNNMTEIVTALGTKIKIGMSWAEFGKDLESFVGSLVVIVDALAKDSFTADDGTVVNADKAFDDATINKARGRMNSIAGENGITGPLEKFKNLMVPTTSLLTQIQEFITGRGAYARLGDDLIAFIKDLVTICQAIGDDKNWKIDGKETDVDELLRNVEKRASSLEKLGDALGKFSNIISTLAFWEGKGSLITLWEEDSNGWRSNGKESYQSVIEKLIADVPKLVESIIDMAKSIELNKQMIDNLGDENTGTISRINKLAEMAKPVTEFIQAFIDLDSTDSDKAGENIKAMLDAFSEVSDDTGRTSLAKFAEGLDEFVVELISTGKSILLEQGAVDAAINAVASISAIKFGESFTDLNVFATGADYLAAALRDIGRSLSDGDVKRALESGSFNQLKSFITSMKEVLDQGVPTFEKTGTDLNVALIEGFTNGGKGEKGRSIKAQLTDILLEACQNVKNYKETYYGIFKDLGKYMVEGFANGFKDSDALAGIRSAAENMVKEAKEATENAAKVQSPSKIMQAVGKYLPLGFAKGIGDRTSLEQVKKSAIAMANTAKTATMKYLEIHSPSKVMETLGQYTVQGFIDGIQNGLPKVQEIAKMLSESISKIPSTIDGEDFANKVLGNVNKVAVASISNAMMQASDGTMSFDEATKNATNSVFQFAAALYAETDAAKSAKEELEELEATRADLEKKRSEAIERETREVAAAQDYMASNTVKALEIIPDEGVRNELKSRLELIYEYKQKLKDPELKDMQKVLIQDALDDEEDGLNEWLDSLDDTKNEGEKSLKDFAKSASDKFKKVKDNALTVIDDVTENVKSANEEYENELEEIAKKNEEIVKEILQQWVDFRNKIRDNVKSFLSIFSGNAIKLDLFTETESAEDKYLEERKSKLEEITEAEEELKQAEEDLLAAQEELAAAQQRSDNVEGRSLIALNDIEEATDKVTEAEQRRLEAQEKLNELNGNLATFDEENSAEGIGNKMLETMEKNLTAYQTYQQQLKSLYDMGINKSYLDELKANGMSSAEQVAKLFAAASSEAMGKEFTEKFNQNIQRQEEIEQESYKQSLVDKTERAKQWSKDIAELEDAGLDKNLIKEISEQGPDNSQLLDLVKKDIEKNGETAVQEWNQLYADLDTTANSVADAITAALSADSEYAKWITAAILQAAGGNAALDVRGEVLQRLLANDEEMRKIWMDTYNATLNKWDDLTEAEKEANYSRVAYASKFAADAVNLAVNKLNKETNGAYAIQNGLVSQLVQPVKESMTEGAKELGTKLEESGAKVIEKSATETAETVAKTTTEVVGDQLDSVKENQTAVVEQVGKVVTEDAEMNRRMETVKNAVLNAISEHQRYMRNCFSALNAIEVKVHANITTQAASVITAITRASSDIVSAIGKISINVQQPQQQAPAPSGGGSSGSSYNVEEQNSKIAAKLEETGKSSFSELVAAIHGVTNYAEAKKAGTATGEAYGNGVAEGTKKSLGIKSPSRVFMEIGKFVDLGFAKGIKDSTPKVISALSALTNVDTSLPLDLGIQNGSLLNFGTTQSLARGLSPNSAVSVERLMRDFMANQSGNTPTNTDNSTNNNYFNITSNNPKEVANEVDRILQQRADRRKSAWA